MKVIRMKGEEERGFCGSSRHERRVGEILREISRDKKEDGDEKRI